MAKEGRPKFNPRPGRGLNPGPPGTSTVPLLADVTFGEGGRGGVVTLGCKKRPRVTKISEKKQHIICFFLEEQFYKNNEAQIWPKIRKNERTIQAGIWNHKSKVYFS